MYQTELFPKPTKPSGVKFVLESIFTITISFLVIAIGFYLFISYYLSKPSSDQNNTQQVLGDTTDKEKSFNQVIINNDDELDEDELIKISSDLKMDNIIFFDNTNREYLEGTTIPNSFIELILGQEKISTKSNPNGFFSIKIPKEMVQFTLGQMNILDDKFQIKTSFKFVLVLREYLDRTYFPFEERDEIFSLEIDNDFKTIRNQFNGMESDYCYVKLDPKVNSRDFDIEKDQDIIVFPPDIETLDFTPENKFVAFRIHTKIDTYEIQQCKSEWQDYEDTLQWHMDEVNTIFGYEDDGIFAPKPISGPEN